MTEEEIIEEKVKQSEYKKNYRKKKKENQTIEKEVKNNKNNDVDVNSDKMKFFENYEKMTDFQSCGICLIETGVNEMVEITEKIHEFCITSGIQELYRQRLKEYKEDSERSEQFVKDLESETNEFGLYKMTKFICTKCYNKIRTTFRKQVKNNKYKIRPTFGKKIKINNIKQNNNNKNNIQHDSSDSSYSTVDDDENNNEKEFEDLKNKFTYIAKHRTLLLLQKRILKKPESERNSDEIRFLEEYSPVINSFYNEADEHMIRIITKQVDAVLLNTTTK
jgi:hypothetical protein